MSVKSGASIDKRAMVSIQKGVRKSRASLYSFMAVSVGEDLRIRSFIKFRSGFG